VGKKFFCFVLLGLLLVGILPLPARADLGPKPSVEVTFNGISGEKVYATLLSKESLWGPYSVWEEGGRSEPEKGDAPEIWEKFVQYKDPDGFYFLQTYWDCTDDPILQWGYWPPETFKILLYFPGTDTFISSSIQESYAFESYYQCFLSDGEMWIRGSYDYKRGLTHMALRAALTVVLELGVALLFGYRGKRPLAVFAVVNVVTQFMLYISLYLITYWRGPWAFWFWFVILELAVLVVEAIAYTLLVERKSRVRWYALAANALSCGAGLVLARVSPNIF